MVQKKTFIKNEFEFTKIIQKRKEKALNMLQKIFCCVSSTLGLYEKVMYMMVTNKI